MISAYIALTKPGIIRGNILTTIAGFFVATRGESFNFTLFIATIVGLSLIIASGCVFNNYLDRNIDKKMDRTKKRALVSGDISVSSALLFGSVLGILGVTVLGLYTNILTMIIGITGFIFYVIIYGIGKRKTVHGTVIGSISGAIPPVVGYTAVTNTLDLGALLLFLILVAWQMPHFYAIAMYRLADYKSAEIPVLPAVQGMRATKNQIIAYIVLFIGASVLLTVFGYTGIVYVILAVLVGLYWLYKGISGLQSGNDVRWAKGMFGISLLVISVFTVAIIIDSVVA